MEIAMLDTSAAVTAGFIEMPNRPTSSRRSAGEFAHTYRLGGPTCLAGDIIGDYSFPEPLKIGDRLVFCDMAHYTMVKNNTFNGVNLPNIATYTEEEGMRVIRRFGFEDYAALVLRLDSWNHLIGCIKFILAYIYGWGSVPCHPH